MLVERCHVLHLPGLMGWRWRGVEKWGQRGGTVCDGLRKEMREFISI